MQSWCWWVVLTYFLAQALRAEAAEECSANNTASWESNVEFVDYSLSDTGSSVSDINSAEKCCAACSADTNCGAWTFEPPVSPPCNLKYAVGTVHSTKPEFKYASGRIIGRNTSCYGPPQSCGVYQAEVGNAKWIGQEIRTITSTDCCANCTADESCVYYHEDQNGACTLLGLQGTTTAPRLQQPTSGFSASYLYYKTYDNYQFGVGVPAPLVSPFFAASGDLCAGLCEVNCKCAVWTYDRAKRMCWLFDGTGVAGQQAVGMTSGVTSAPSPQFNVTKVDVSITSPKSSSVKTITKDLPVYNPGDKPMVVNTLPYLLNFSFQMDETLYTGFNASLVFDLTTLHAQFDGMPALISIVSAPLYTMEQTLDDMLNVDVTIAAPLSVAGHTFVNYSVEVEILPQLEIEFEVSAEVGMCGGSLGLPTLDMPTRRTFLGKGRFCGSFKDSKEPNVATVKGKLILYDLPVAQKTQPTAVNITTDDKCSPNFGGQLLGPDLDVSCQASWQECCAACRQRLECVGWTLSPGTPASCATSKSCRIKSVLMEGPPDTDSVFGLVQANFSDPAVQKQTSCYAQIGMEAMGDLLKNEENVVSWPVCCALCQSNPACAAWNFHIRGTVNRCNLLKVHTGYKPNLGDTEVVGGAVIGDLDDCNLVPGMQPQYAPESVITNHGGALLSSAYQCCQLCSRDASCVAFDYSFDGLCTLLNGYTGVSEELGSIVGFKQAKGKCWPQPVQLKEEPVSAALVLSPQRVIGWQDVCCFNNLVNCSDALYSKTVLLPCAPLQNATCKQELAASFGAVFPGHCSDASGDVSGVAFVPYQSSSSGGSFTVVPSQDTCCELCSMDPSCAAFTFHTTEQVNVSSGSCHLMLGGVGGAMADRSAISRVKESDDGRQCPAPYTVQRDETLARIARNQMDGMISWQQICCFNKHIRDCREVPPGTHIFIPCNVTDDVECTASIAAALGVRIGDTQATSSVSSINWTALGVAIAIGIAAGLSVIALTFMLCRRRSGRRSKLYYKVEDLVQPLPGRAVSVADMKSAMMTTGNKYSWIGGHHKGSHSFVMFGIMKTKSNKAVAAKFYHNVKQFQVERAFYHLGIAAGHVPEVYDIFEANGDGTLSCVVMEKGDFTLAEWLSSTSKPEPHEVDAMIMDVMKAVQSLHARKVAHMGLKPDNVMYFGSTVRWMLIDFSASSHIMGPVDKQHINVRYAAPEVVQSIKKSKGPVVARTASDMWSLGVMLWEMLTGEPMFGEEYSEQEVVEMLLGTTMLPYEKHKALWSAIPNEKVRGIIQSLLRRYPNDRLAVDGCLKVMAADGNLLLEKQNSIDNLMSPVTSLTELGVYSFNTGTSPALVVCITFEELKEKEQLLMRQESSRSMVSDPIDNHHIQLLKATDSSDMISLDDPPLKQLDCLGLTPDVQQTFQRYISDLYYCSEAPLEIVEGDAEVPSSATVLLHKYALCAVRMMIMYGKQDSVSVPIETLEELILVPHDSRDVDQCTVIPVVQLDDSNDSAWHGFGIFHSAILATGSNDMDVIMVMRMKDTGARAQLRKRISFRLYPKNRGLLLDRENSVVCDEWINVPEWVKLRAIGLTLFAQYP